MKQKVPRRVDVRTIPAMSLGTAICEPLNRRLQGNSEQTQPAAACHRIVRVFGWMRATRACNSESVNAPTFVEHRRHSSCRCASLSSTLLVGPTGNRLSFVGARLSSIVVFVGRMIYAASIIGITIPRLRGFPEIWKARTHGNSWLSCLGSAVARFIYEDETDAPPSPCEETPFRTDSGHERPLSGDAAERPIFEADKTPPGAKAATLQRQFMSTT